MGKLIPAILALLGLAAGAGAGLFLRPPPDTQSAPPTTEGAQDNQPSDAKAPDQGTPVADAKDKATQDEHAAAKTGGKPTHDYVKMNNQFVVPVVQNGRVAAMVILSISLEVEAGATEQVYQVEPKLRDGFLQVMFDHANTGGFMGTFTDGSNMILLREALHEVAQSTLGPTVTDVLIVDIVRQDS